MFRLFSRSRGRRHYRTPSTRHSPLTPEVKRGIIIIALFTVSLFSLLSFFEATGSIGKAIVTFLGRAFGWMDFVIPALLLITSLSLIRRSIRPVTFIHYLGLAFIILGGTGIAHLPVRDQALAEILETGAGGGVVGYSIGSALFRAADVTGASIILVALTIIGVFIFFGITFEHINRLVALAGGFLGSLWGNGPARAGKRDEDYVVNFHTEKIAADSSESEPPIAAIEEESAPEEDAGTLSSDELIETSADAIKPVKSQRKIFPKIEIPISFLTASTDVPASGDIKASVKKIEAAFKSFGIDVTMGDVNVGPTVTQYTLKPLEGVKLNQITALNSDLALALAAHPIRIEAPIPGKSLVGIEVPNQAVSVVKLREILESQSWQTRKSNLTIALGKDVMGKAMVADLAKMPHLLIAGATGSGKSVAINSIIVSLLYQNSPDALKLILVDPKRVELSAYDGIPHLAAPVIIDIEKTINALRWAVAQMDERYKLLAAAGKKNIQSYNDARLVEKMPYIIIIIDELADLMMVAAKEVESAIIRLAQMARAVGIHLILATQRPSVNVITGLIKANITSRIAFAVASSTDSRTIIDSAGADKLLGNGDMLYISAELSKPRRIQGALITDTEISAVTDYLKAHGEPEYEEGVTERKTGGTSATGSYDDGADERDVRLAAEVVIKAKRASATLLQSRMRVGFAKASRLLDILEDRGVIGQQNSSKPREVLMTEEEFKTQMGGSTPASEELYDEPPADEIPDEEFDDDDDDIERPQQ